MSTRIFCSLLIFFSLQTWAQTQDLPPGHPAVDSASSMDEKPSSIAPPTVDPEQALFELRAITDRLDPKPVSTLPMQQNGRIKPLHSLARETILFIGGSYSLFSIDPVSLFLGLPLSPTATSVAMIEVRDPKLREVLGFFKTQRRYSIAELEKSPLTQLAQPLMEKEQRNSRSISPTEKKVLEAYQQLFLARMVVDGSLFLQAIDFKPLMNQQTSTSDAEVIQAGQAFLKGLAGGQATSEVEPALRQAILAQPVPEMLKWQLGHLDREVMFNKAHLFFLTAILLFLIGCALTVPQLSRFASDLSVGALLILPVLLVAVGLGIRVSLTGFAPVTNMYGTMIWVSEGILIFSSLLFLLYRNRTLTGILCLASSLVLFLTDSIPLVLSPDLDPIVAVLRSNYWLTIHVLTITISYAAFSIAMIIGNTALIRVLFFNPTDNKAFFKTYAHYAYRIIQLGVFLLTAGIILGGVWADYSWGRFWGWDPKETWALIADVGFLAILHARFTGWLRDFGILAASTVAYLLVIMAWYGVNFILAAGLHSYGFSSGGAWAVGIFVSIQMLLLLVALGVYISRSTKRPIAH